MNAFADRTAGSLYAACLLRDTAAGGAPQRPSSLCPMRAVKLNAFAILKLASACHVSQNISSKHFGGHIFLRFPCVRSHFSRTEFSFNTSRASEATFHARSSLSTLPVRQKLLFTHGLRPERHSREKTTWPKPAPNQSPPPSQTPPTLPRKTSSSTRRNINSRPEGRLQS